MVIPESIEFDIDGPPVPCARPRVVRKGSTTRTFMPGKTVAYEQHVRAAGLARRPDGWPLDKRYQLTIEIYRAARRGDWDNFGKAISDGLQGVLWKNDGSIVDATVRIFEKSKDPRAHVTVEILDDDYQGDEADDAPRVCNDCDGKCSFCDDGDDS